MALPADAEVQQAFSTCRKVGCIRHLSFVPKHGCFMHSTHDENLVI